MLHSNDGTLDPGGDMTSRELLLGRALAEYLDRLAADESPDPGEFLKEHPDMAEGLGSALQTIDDISELITGVPCPPRFGEFELVRCLSGCFGIVYEAWQRSLQRRVALRILPGALLDPPDAIRRFEQKAEVLGSLSHPNIAGLLAWGVEDRTPFFAMEFVDGITLKHLLLRDGAARLRARDSAPEDQELPDWPRLGAPARDDQYFQRLAEAFAGAADGLHHAHTHGVVHGCLNPSNLIIDTEGRLRILNFGLAGMLPYLSPEQARRSPGKALPGGDIYSLGAALYEMLAGRPPFESGKARGLIRKCLLGRPVRPSAFNPAVPRDIELIALMCLRKDPRRRYRTAEALAQDLYLFARDYPVEARAESAIDVAKGLIKGLSFRRPRAR
jgi:serine/threonine protein kinase